MKKIFLLLILTGLSLPAFSQHTELKVALNSGIFFFAGPRATKESYINDAPGGNAYTNNPYGSLPSPIFGLAFNLKKVTPYHLVFGFDIGYDFLRSNIRIIDLNRNGQMFTAIGHTHINQDFINLFPEIGYRFRAGKCSIDALLGFDLAYGFQLNERGHATADGNKYYTKGSYSATGDFRPRIQVDAAFEHMSFFMSYADGLIPYDIGEIGVPKIGTFARIWRAGIAYRLNR